MKNRTELDFISTASIVKLRHLAESYWNSLKSKSIENIDENEIEKIIKESIERDIHHWKYSKDVDLLFISFSELTSSYGNIDYELGVISFYIDEKIVSIEVLDLLRIFPEIE